VSRTFLNEDKFLIRDAAGEVLLDNSDNLCTADHIVNATGYVSDVGDKYADLCRAAGTTYAESLRPYAMGGTDIQIGKKLTGFPDILIGGTAIDPGYDNPAKVEQLPQSSQEVLRCIGENVVALGFTGADTRAAVTQFLGERIARQGVPAVEAAPPMVIDASVADALPYFKGAIEQSLPAVDKRLAPDPELLTSLFVQGMPAHVVKVDGNTFTGTFSGHLNLTDRAVVKFAPAEAIPLALSGLVCGAASEPFMRAYAAEALHRSRRRSSELEVTLHYQNGQLDMGNSIVQVA
jgi:hypothetical protein